MAKFVDAPRFMSAEAGDGYWSIAAGMGYPAGAARDQASVRIQAANNNQPIYPGTLIMIPADLPAVPAPAPATANYADWWWNKNGGDPRTATLSEYLVTTTADSGPGSLRQGLMFSNRRIKFAGPLTIINQTPIVTTADNIHIQGGGSTIKHSAIKFEGTDIVIDDLRFFDATASAAEDCLTFRNASRTQVFAIRGCVFDTAADGGLDVIWNRGNNVYGLVERCHFKRIDKACLIDSGDDPNEGGRYHITFIDPVWEDCIQRMPMARNAHIHIKNPRFVRFGDHVGAGGGAKAAGGCQMLVENAIIVPRKTGETMFTGATVTKPRVEAVGPHQPLPSGFVRAINCPPAPQVNQQDPTKVLAPPY